MGKNDDDFGIAVGLVILGIVLIIGLFLLSKFLFYTSVVLLFIEIFMLIYILFVDEINVLNFNIDKVWILIFIIGTLFMMGISFWIYSSLGSFISSNPLMSSIYNKTIGTD